MDSNRIPSGCPFHQLSEQLGGITVAKAQGLGSFGVFGDTITPEKIREVCDGLQKENFSEYSPYVFGFDVVSERGQKIIEYLQKNLSVSEEMKEGFFVPAFRTLETLMLPAVNYVQQQHIEIDAYIREVIVPLFQNYKIFHPEIEEEVLDSYPHQVDAILGGKMNDWKLCPAFPYMEEIMLAVTPHYFR